MSQPSYGQPPVPVQQFELGWDEYMHYLYLPVWMPTTEFVRVRLPERLEFLRIVVNSAIGFEHSQRETTRWLRDHYIYVTARRGYATPGNPLNRPGWHADGFGSQDINYIWSDRWPTRFAVGEFGPISDDHVESAHQFDVTCNYALDHGIASVKVYDGAPKTLYRLDPSMIHSTPLITEGGDRSFLKISISKDRYNLRGNSHNHLFDYQWRMWDRAEVRNDPAYAGGDAGPQGEPVRERLDARHAEEAPLYERLGGS